MYPKISVEIEKCQNVYDPLDANALDHWFYNDDGIQIGHASVSSYNTPIPFLYDFSVYEEYRGQGYGNAIMEYLMNAYNITQVCVLTDNYVAINLYKKFGFHILRKFMEGKNELYEMVTKDHKPELLAKK